MEILKKNSIKKPKIIQTSFNKELALKAISTLGGESFVIDKYNEQVIMLLLAYFHGLPIFETAFPERNYSLHKGIMLVGKIGTGKSTLMDVFARYCKLFLPHHKYIFIDVRRVANHFMTEGNLDKYTYNLIKPRLSYERKPTTNYCFDDLGTEAENVKFYGTEIDPIRELLMDRYNLFKSHGIITHATTNLDFAHLKERYGERLASRMREMFNFIILEGFDRRH